MVTHVQTITKTYTKIDVRRVFESCMADIRMIAWRTEAIEESAAMETMQDVQIMAEEGCLRAVHVQLCDQSGRVIRAHLYTATDGAATSERPGGNKWPRTPHGEVRIIVTIDQNAGWDKATKRLRRSWGPSQYSLDYAALTQGGMRTFSHGGYGLTRLSYG